MVLEINDHACSLKRRFLLRGYSQGPSALPIGRGICLILLACGINATHALCVGKYRSWPADGTNSASRASGAPEGTRGGRDTERSTARTNGAGGWGLQFPCRRT